MGVGVDMKEAEKVSYKIVAEPPSHIKLGPHEQFIFIKHKQFHKAEGVAGILSHPKSMQYAQLSDRLKNEDQLGLPQHRLVLLVHGHQAHKNSNYQPILASKLAGEGFYVLRIDFRGLGDSEDCKDVSLGRTIEQDTEDIESVCELISCERLRDELFELPVTLDTIVGHSRGVMAMFEFCRRYPNRFVPNLVNCSGRYDGRGIVQKRLKYTPNWRKDGGFYCDLPRHGGVVKTWIPKSETMSGVECPTHLFGQINQQSSIMSCYGTCEEVIPLTAVASFANLFQGRHYLEMIRGATHNFYGLPNDPNALKLPLRNGLVNYCYVVADKIAEYLSWEKQLQRFYAKTQYIKGTPINPAEIVTRWPLPHAYSKVSNFRDLGGYQTVYQGRRIKTGCFYRCANVCDITPDALKYLQHKLDVVTVFDLRAPDEAKENGLLDNNKLVKSLPFNNNMNTSPEVLAEHYQGLLISSYSFPKAYMIVLKNSIDSIKTFFQFLLEPQGAVAFHCTAGKDRTGILSMLLLSILGVDDDTIAREYELTTLGLKTETKLIKKLEARGDLYYSMLGPNSEALVKEYHLTPDKMAKTLLSSRYEAMRFFIDDFRAEYESADSFFMHELQFSTHAIGRLRDLYLEE
ncbi:uncharacterized protein ZBAI_08992 [Zygosaccharomyces bailii ISA1307]|uniref:ZYBA0S11-01266g1_1 n=1 Tax=Zygosaccharomyces bailii (strain CLIB 213 / ATCC 58445 / CBS 680 / BCRC 21525 / NBRC 1098 / NCYC 1416 / NRRL Y-2227) TaxID=1333698 RepID=A0A8J2TAD0_ZYGB2|nr:ZYBA0S11-01266g1_1 [Zygosaccharomyces bailii CLIB 213]CDH17204.1 uncharacterized protein ZBAI_08992 [Zygosaccharomyces bailii ISA1307]